jgi:hypothetical protein
MTTDYLPWISLALLGAFHGLNPGMGWLFAVSLGLQERSRGAVLRAFGPIALGHAASVATIVALVGLARLWLDPQLLRLGGAAALVAFGAYKLAVPMSHPRWVGMRVGPRDLATWSFLMATAHGAGLMLVPVLLGLSSGSAAGAGHAEHLMMSSAVVAGNTDLAAVALHTAAMFAVMAAIALVVFEKIGLAILRRAWFNVDRLWAVAIFGSGALTFAL